jgi:type IV fimbrial biogenesis protein FimT
MLVLKQNFARAVKCATGFSLVELLVVVAILAIISGFGVPAFKTWIADAKTRTVAEALQNGLRIAQTEAIRRGVQVQFVLTDSAPNATVTASSITGRNWVAQSMLRAAPGTVDQFIQGANLNAVSNTSLVSASDATVTFNSLGRVVSPTNAVTYTLSNADGGRHLNLTLSLAGKIRMCDPDKNLTNSPDGCVAS